jgi:hypothetical protein
VFGARIACKATTPLTCMVHKLGGAGLVSLVAPSEIILWNHLRINGITKKAAPGHSAECSISNSIVVEIRLHSPRVKIAFPTRSLIARSALALRPFKYLAGLHLCSLTGILDKFLVGCFISRSSYQSELLQAEDITM